MGAGDELGPKASRSRRIDLSTEAGGSDGSDAASPLSCCRGGAGGLIDGELAGISRAGPVSVGFPQRNEARLTPIGSVPTISYAMCWWIRTRYWRSMTNLGIGFLLLDVPTPRSPPTSASRVTTGCYWISKAAKASCRCDCVIYRYNLPIFQVAN